MLVTHSKVAVAETYSYLQNINKTHAQGSHYFILFVVVLEPAIFFIKYVTVTRIILSVNSYMWNDRKITQVYII